MGKCSTCWGKLEDVAGFRDFGFRLGKGLMEDV